MKRSPLFLPGQAPGIAGGEPELHVDFVTPPHVTRLMILERIMRLFSNGAMLNISAHLQCCVIYTGKNPYLPFCFDFVNLMTLLTASTFADGSLFSSIMLCTVSNPAMCSSIAS